MENKQFRNEVSKLVGEITKLAVLVNSTTEYYCGVDFAGHVDEFQLSIAPNREAYMGREEGTVKKAIYIDGWSTTAIESKENVIKKLNEMKQELQNIFGVEDEIEKLRKEIERLKVIEQAYEWLKTAL